MEKIIATFFNPKTGQKITYTLNNDEYGLDAKCRFDPIPQEGTPLGLVGYFADLFINAVSRSVINEERNENENTADNSSRESSLRD